MKKEGEEGSLPAGPPHDGHRWLRQGRYRVGIGLAFHGESRNTFQCCCRVLLPETKGLQEKGGSRSPPSVWLLGPTLFFEVEGRRDEQKRRRVP
jgi:hypothetical protein